MIENGRKGRLLATGSIAGARPFADGGPYCASKAGVKALVESAALAFAADGITVNAVAPGSADTELYRYAMAQIGSRAGRSVEELVDDEIQAVPLGRMVAPDDIANAFLFLAGEQSAFITGVTLTCDGGSILV
jgi:NAD(P)-dependent dehydrogenase (short-subunit alcohol dehydrogenase family)